MIKITLVSVLSLITLIAGVSFYLMWGVAYGVWADIGIYSITIVLVLGGILGLLLTFFGEKEK